jgi:hypothetical protein
MTKSLLIRIRRSVTSGARRGKPHVTAAQRFSNQHEQVVTPRPSGEGRTAARGQAGS